MSKRIKVPNTDNISLSNLVSGMKKDKINSIGNNIKNKFFITLKNETQALVISGLISFFIIILFILIYFSSPEIKKFAVDFGYKGFKNFMIFFEFPIKLAVFLTTIFGIYLAYKNYTQLKNQFYKEYNLHQENINTNNYYKHLEEYIKIINQYINEQISNPRISHPKPDDEYDYDLITDNFIRSLFRVWFGTDFRKPLQIKNNILENITKLYKICIRDFEILLDFKKSHFQNTHSIFKELGFIKIAPKISKKYNDYDIAKLIVILSICKRTLEFINIDILNSKTVYERLSVY